MRILDIEDVRKNFENLIEEAANGNPFIISVKGKSKVMVLPIDEAAINHPTDEA